MKRRVFTHGAILLLCLSTMLGNATASTAAEPSRMREGTLAGADYLISMPAQWNGGLVMFAHGYEGEVPGTGTVRASPLDFHLRDHGYGYRSKGYRPDWFLADMLALRELFIKEIGQPHWTIIHGQSMGGHVAIASPRAPP